MIRRAAAAWILAASSGYCCAQTFTAKTIRIIVPYPAGGGVDITGRAIAQQLNATLGVAVIVDNRPGAGGVIGTDLVARSAPDGYTLLVSGRGPLVAAALTNPQLPYAPLRDIAPVGNLVIAPYILAAHPVVPARNARELIALAQKQPGRLNFV